MGYELKRVDRNFDWPMRQTWEGYVNTLYSVFMTFGSSRPVPVSLTP